MMNRFEIQVHFDDGPTLVVSDETTLSREELLEEMSQCMERGKVFFVNHIVVSTTRVRYIRVIEFKEL